MGKQLTSAENAEAVMGYLLVGYLVDERHDLRSKRLKSWLFFLILHEVPPQDPSGMLRDPLLRIPGLSAHDVLANLLKALLGQHICM